jgi:hypothetical protein
MNARGIFQKSKDTFSDRAGPRIFVATDVLPIPDALQIPLLQGRISPVPTAQWLDDLAREHGSALAGYRLRHIRQFAEGDPALIADPHGLAILERTICSCVFDDESLKGSVGPLLRRQFGVRANFEAHDNLFILAQVLVSFVHDHREEVSVRELMDRMELLTTLRGDTDQGALISVGRMLSKLGVRRDHTNKLNVVVLDPGNKNAIHQVAWVRGVLTQQNLSPGCLFCDWLAGKDGLAIDQDDVGGGEGNEESEEMKPS